MPMRVSYLTQIAVFCFSIAILGIQVVLTRLFSFMIWYHFAFLVISVAMLGFTAGGLIFNIKPTLLNKSPDQFLSLTSMLFALVSVLGLLIIINLPFDGSILSSAGNFTLFIILILIIGFCFFFAGSFIAFVISTAREHVSRVYFANMTGSGAGCALSVLFLDNMLPATALIAFSLLAALSSLLLILQIENNRRSGPAAIIITGLLIFSYIATLDPMSEPFFIKSTKEFPDLKKSQIIRRTSNSYATVDFFRNTDLSGLWGMSYAHYKRDHPDLPIPARIGYCIDGWALTFAYNAEGEITRHPVFDYLPSTLAYRIKPLKKVLIIGAGGGIDIITAIRNNARDITAVDINPGIISAGTDYLSEFNQDIFNRPGVHPVICEGRSYMTAAGNRKWDLIQLSGVDTLAAGQSGAFTLSENYLYTIEAFETYLSRLKNDGLLTLTRWIYSPPRQTLRVITIADAALKSFGVKDSSRHVILIQSNEGSYSVFVISKNPFTKKDSQRVLAACKKYGFVPLALPYTRIQSDEKNLFQNLLNTKDKSEFISRYPFDISVSTDNKPFFMEHSKWTNAWKHSDYIFSKSNGHLLLLLTTMIVALFAVIFILIPSRFIKRHKTGNTGRLRALGFFSCLGLGFILIEIVLVQKFTFYLGNPSYALAVVLAAILVFSGIGSRISANLPVSKPVSIITSCAGIAFFIAGYRFLMDPVLNATLYMDLGVRIVIVLLLLSIPATLMGIPFPVAVAGLSRSRQDLVVGGWVVNGYFSVLASCLAMVISISCGFHVVLLLSAVIYAMAAISRPVVENIES